MFFVSNIAYRSPTPHSDCDILAMPDWHILRYTFCTYFFVTNILKWSPLLSHQHNDVTNITVIRLGGLKRLEVDAQEIRSERLKSNDFTCVNYMKCLKKRYCVMWWYLNFYLKCTRVQDFLFRFIFYFQNVPLLQGSKYLRCGISNVSFFYPILKMIASLKSTNGLIHFGSKDRPVLSIIIKLIRPVLLRATVNFDPWMYGPSTLDLIHFVIVKRGQPGKKQKWTKLWETDNQNSKAWIIINILCNIWDKSLFVVQELKQN